MKIYNVIWLRDLEPSVQSYYNFDEALESVKSDIRSFEKTYGFTSDRVYQDGNYFFARMEDVYEVEVLEAEIR